MSPKFWISKLNDPQSFIKLWLPPPSTFYLFLIQHIIFKHRLKIDENVINIQIFYFLSIHFLFFELIFSYLIWHSNVNYRLTKQSEMASFWRILLIWLEFSRIYDLDAAWMFKFLSWMFNLIEFVQFVNSLTSVLKY